MNPLPVDFHPPAVAEARAARLWYHRRSPAVAIRFAAELDSAILRISNTPQAFGTYLHGTRVYRLRRFSYVIVYQELAVAIRVLAVAHGKRRPGYWRRRLP